MSRESKAMEKSFRKYLVWQKAHALAVEMCLVTKSFSKEWDWLASQLRRASFSVPVNFVEGYLRGSTKEFLRFLDISKGSLAEVEYELEFSKDVGVLTIQDYQRLDKLRGEVAGLLSRFISAVKENS